MKSLILALVIVGAILFLANGPYDAAKRTSDARQVNTDDPSRDMEIAIVWPGKDGEYFDEGVDLAVEDINQRGGITIADAQERPVKVRIKAHHFEEPADSDAGKFAARIAGNTHLSAVIGHNSPDGAIAASVAYEDNGLAYISPNVSDLRLSSHGLRMFIQSIPDDETIATAMIEFALSRRWTSAAILYARDTYGMTYANLLREQIGQLSARVTNDSAETVPMQLVMQESYSDSPEGFYLLISQLLERKFDVVIVADSLIGRTAPRAIKLIKQMREMGVSQPILGTEELDIITLWEKLGPRANNIFSAAMYDFHSKHASPLSRQMAANFEARYGTIPTQEAAAAYEAVMLLAEAAERARSKVPIKLATMFKSTREWKGMQGETAYEFNLNGTVRDKGVWVHEMKDGRIVEIARIDMHHIVVRSNRYANLDSQHADFRSAYARPR